MVSGIQTRKLAEVITLDRPVGQTDFFRQTSAASGEPGQDPRQFPSCLDAFIRPWLIPHTAIQFSMNRMFATPQAVHDKGHTRTQPLQQRIDNVAQMPLSQMILDWGAEIADPGRFGSGSLLPVIDSPGMDDDDRRAVCPEPVRHFDDAAVLVGQSPGTDRQIGAALIDEHRSFLPHRFPDGVNEYGIAIHMLGISEQ